jgi:hypothetical protein
VKDHIKQAFATLLEKRFEKDIILEKEIKTIRLNLQNFLSDGHNENN